MNIHKAARPKKYYVDPTLCILSSRSGNENFYHQNSRTAWKKVTCKLCIKFKRKK